MSGPVGQITDEVQARYAVKYILKGVIPNINAAACLEMCDALKYAAHVGGDNPRLILGALMAKLGVSMEVRAEIMAGLAEEFESLKA